MNPHFASLVMGLATQAESILQGKLPAGLDTLSPQQVRQMAQSLSDTLGMLEVKTTGHLDPEEQRLLTESLTALRFRFVQTSGTGH